MVDTKLETENHEEIVSNTRIVGVEAVDTNSDFSHEHQPPLDNQTNQGINITSMNGNSISSNVGALTTGSATIVAPSETTVNDDTDNTDFDSDYSYMFYSYPNSEASESDNESDDSSLNTPRSVLCSKLFSCSLSSNSSSDSDTITDDNANGSICVVAGCRMCMLYIMVPAGTDVCFRCGNSGLVHFDSNGQA